MSDAEGRRPRRGRPPAKAGPKDKPGLGALLSARISHEVKAALEAEADRTGRSISQIAERWLDEARNAHANVESLLGGEFTATAIQQLLRVARVIEAAAPDLPFKHQAIVEGWKSTLTLLNTDTDPPEIFNETVRVAASASVALDELISWLERQPPEHPASQELQPSANGLFGLLSFEAFPAGVPKDTLAQLNSGGLAEIRRALPLIEALNDRLDPVPQESIRSVAALKQLEAVYAKMLSAEREAAALGRTIARSLTRSTTAEEVEA